MMRAVGQVIAAALLSAVLLAAVSVAMHLAGLSGYDPYWIDYDRPGVDITSEGP